MPSPHVPRDSQMLEYATVEGATICGGSEAATAIETFPTNECCYVQGEGKYTDGVVCSGLTSFPCSPPGFVAVCMFAPQICWASLTSSWMRPVFKYRALRFARFCAQISRQSLRAVVLVVVAAAVALWCCERSRYERQSTKATVSETY